VPEPSTTTDTDAQPAAPVEAKLNRYERATRWPMVAFSVLYVAVLLAQVWAPDEWGTGLLVVDWILYCLFVVDFFIRLALAQARGAFLRDFWSILDMIVIASPLLALFAGRLFGLARVGRVIRLLRVVRVQALIVRAVGRTVKALAKPGNTKFILLFAVLLVLIAAFGIWRWEAPVNAGIHTWGDALWWSLVTMVTVGYSDPTPITSEGRVFALMLIPAGLALVAWLTALLASYFVEEAEERVEHPLEERPGEIEQQLNRIERLLDGDGQPSEEAAESTTVGAPGDGGPLRETTIVNWGDETHMYEARVAAGTLPDQPKEMDDVRNPR
jgi:voltage-gated potassium channel